MRKGGSIVKRERESAWKFRGSSYRESGELLSASGAQQTEEDQQWADAHPVAAWQGVAPNLRTLRLSHAFFLSTQKRTPLFLEYFECVSLKIRNSPCAQKKKKRCVRWS